jgi:hypothetical protein
LQPVLDEHALLMRGGVVCFNHYTVQLIEICLDKITRTNRVMIFDDNRDNSALFVVADLCVLCKRLRRIHGVPLVIHGLQMETIDQMTAHGTTLKQADE